MAEKRWKQILTGLLENKNTNRCSYVRYTDSSGNELTEEDIIFTNEESFKGKQTLQIWGEEEKNIETYTVSSPGVELIYDEAGNFPVALKSPEGELMYLKVSAKTGEVLPIHAGCCQSLDVIYTGPPHAGKTVNILQMSDAAFHDTIVRNTNCSFEDDLPSSAPARKRYEEAGNNLKNHILPEPTKRGEIIMPYIYYVTYAEEGQKKHILVRFQDIDGQECVDLSWKSKIFPYNYFFLTIGADELIAGERGLPVQYTKVVDKLIPRLRVLRRDMDYEMIVIISKCDLLDHDNKYLKTAFNNSIAMENGRMRQTIHDKGFDFETFIHRGNCVKAYLKAECPNFYNKLVNSVPNQKITFCMIASIGAACEGNSFDTYQPFCIDEPILSILAKNGMYPIAVCGEKPKVERVGGHFGNDEKIRKLFKSWLEAMKITDDDDEEYEEDMRNVD